MVPQGLHQYRLPQGARRLDLGRMGRRERRPRPGVWLPVALLAGAGRPPHRPDRQPDGDAEEESGLAPADRLRLEPGADRRDGPAALPRAVPVLRRRRQAQLPALPTFGGHLPRRTLQYRQLCPADPDGGAGRRPAAGRVHLDRRRLPPVRQPPGAGRPAADPRAAAVAEHEAESRGEGSVRLSLRGLRAGRLRGPSAHQGTGRGLTLRRSRRLRSTEQATVPGKRAPVPQSPLRIFCALQRLFQGLLQRSDRMAHGMAMAELEVVQQVRR